MTTERLYVVVDGSLAPGLQIAQAIHAKDEFTRAHPAAERAWGERSNTIAVLAVVDGRALRALLARCVEWDVAHARFDEPDLGGATTAVALAPGPLSARLVRGLKPALG